jgi:hypothetical protein
MMSSNERSNTSTQTAETMPSNKRSITSTNSSDTAAEEQEQNVLLVPTVTAKKDTTKELDLHSMTEEDLKLLQKKGM